MDNVGRFVDLEENQPQQSQEIPEYQKYLPERLRGIRIPWGPIGEQVYRRTYSQRKQDGRSETWPETVVRAVNGNCDLVDPQFIEPDEREKLYDLLMTFKGLPAGRHLNASGMKGRQFLFNCHASGWDYSLPSLHFTFLFDQLMQGGGVGANYSNRYLNQMPVVGTRIELHIVCREDHPNIKEFEDLLSKKFQIPEIFSESVWSEAEGTTIKVSQRNIRGLPVFRVQDSREGWVESVDHVIRHAYEKVRHQDPINDAVIVIVDVSQVRSRGKPLKTSGGIACGPQPLVKMSVDMVDRLNVCVGRRMTSVEAMWIDHTLSACVVAGGKRRSSRMSVKNWRDADIFEFIDCKKKDGDHWTTNISVEVDDDFFAIYNDQTHAEFMHARLVMMAVVRGKRLNGEPGLWNRSLAAKGEREPEQMYCPNPCGEIGLYMWENCNLGHINLAAFVRKPLREMEEAFRLMTRWLIRATFGDIPNPRQREVVDRNRRIGVGFFGFHEWIAMNGIRYSESADNEWVRNCLKTCQYRIEHEAYRYSQQLGIPVPCKNTTLAPTGTTAILPGTTSSAQAMMAPWFKRLVRYSSMDPELAVLKLQGYETLIDEDALNTEIVVFWCEDPLVAKVRAAGWDETTLEGQYDIPFEASLKLQAMLQDVWANNAISFTINLKKETMPTEAEMETALMEYLPRLKGTTVFAPVTRKNVPIQPVTKEQFEAHLGPKERTMVEDECKGGCPVG